MIFFKFKRKYDKVTAIKKSNKVRKVNEWYVEVMKIIMVIIIIYQLLDTNNNTGMTTLHA